MKIGTLIKSMANDAGKLVGNIANGLQDTTESAVGDSRDLGINTISKGSAAAYQIGSNLGHGTVNTVKRAGKALNEDHEQLKQDADDIKRVALDAGVIASNAYDITREKVGKAFNGIKDKINISKAKDKVAEEIKTLTKLVNNTKPKTTRKGKKSQPKSPKTSQPPSATPKELEEATV